MSDVPHIPPLRLGRLFGVIEDEAGAPFARIHLKQPFAQDLAEEIARRCNDYAGLVHRVASLEIERRRLQAALDNALAGQLRAEAERDANALLARIMEPNR